MNQLQRPGLLVLLLLALGAPSRGAEQPTSTAAAGSGELSPERFRTPPREAGVHVWWHWMDGAISREGITKDLEAMRAQGVVQATILNVGLFPGRDFGVPRVVFASAEWFGMVRWALAEAARLGITIGVHNCDGWSSSGGPWVEPAQSMKQYAWTKTLVSGGSTVDVQLPKPAEVSGFYRDVAVVAFRTAQRASAYRGAGVQLQLNGAAAPAGALSDGSPVSSVVVKRGDRLVLSAGAPLEFERVALHLRRPFTWANPAEFATRLTVETSPDGKEYRALAELATKGLNATQVLEVPRASARFVRLTVAETSTADSWIPLELGELELLRAGESPAYAPSIPFVGEKTSSVKAARDEDVETIGSDSAAIAPRDVLVLDRRMDVDGRLRWAAPAGTWAVLRFGYTSTGATNAPATAEGRGLECDKLDRAAVEHHFRSFPQKVIDEAGEHAGKTLRFVLVDSWEAGFQNWTASLPAEFEKRRGYSLVPWLPVLAGETVASARESEGVLFDFRQTIADLIRENYYDRLADLLHERGVELHAEVIYGGGGYPPLDVLRSTQKVDLPMFEFWTSTSRDNLLEYKPAPAPEMNLPACAAAGYGKALLGSEAYTGMAHYSESPAELKPYGDRAFTAGINRMILHSSVHQPNDDRPGMTLGQFASHFNRNNTYWSYASAWLTYQARIQSLLGLGTPAVDVLYFLGDQLPQSYVRNAATDVPAGYTVSAVNADILGSRVTVADGRLKLNGEGGAALLALPPRSSMSLATLRRIDSLVRQGAHVYGPKPQRTLSLADARETGAFQALAERVWGSLDGRSTFTRAHGMGRVSWGRPIGDVLAELGVRPQFAASPVGERDFLFAHRVVGDADVFFVTNQWDRPLDRELSFRVGAKAPEVRDPASGRVWRPAAFRVEGGVLTLPVRFAPRQALLFVFRGTLPGRFVTSVERVGTTLFPSAGGIASVPELRFDGEGSGVSVTPDVTGNLALRTNDGRAASGSFEAPGPLPIAGLRGTLELRGPGVATTEPFAIADLRPLTDYEAPWIRYFSGEAVYRLTFSAPDLELAAEDRLELDLGGFEAVAHVVLNGRDLGRVWNPGTALDVTGLLRVRDNELVVTVANVYRNRLIGDLAQFGELKTVRTSSPVKDFLAADRPLKRSGLFGPIRVIRVREQRLVL